MLRAGIAGLLCLLVASCQTAPPGEPATAIVNATIIDMQSGETNPVDLLITGERIVATAPRGALAVPRGARVVDAQGLYAMPGLWDAHVHLTGDPEFQSRAPKLLIANGVTSVRDMAGDTDAILALRAKASSGEIVSPHIWAAGRIIEGDPAVRPDHSFVVTNAAEAESAVDSLAASGVDFIKAYEMLAPEPAAAAVARAHARGLKIVGHLPIRMSAAQALAAGYDGFEHLRGFEFDCAENPERLLAARVALMDAHSHEPGGALRRRVHAAVRPEAYAHQDPARCAALIEEFRRRGTWHAPTLAFVGFRSLRYYERPGWTDAFDYLPAPTRAQWLSRVAEFTDATKYTEWAAQGLWARRIVGDMHRAGVNLMTGTDTGQGYIFMPGFSLQDELQAFVDSDVPALATLQAATINPARFFGLEGELGLIREGYIADVVLLRGNPLVDIAGTRSIEAVVARGRLFDRATLDAMLAEMRTSAN